MFVCVCMLDARDCQYIHVCIWNVFIDENMNDAEVSDFKLAVIFFNWWINKLIKIIIYQWSAAKTKRSTFPPFWNSWNCVLIIHFKAKQSLCNLRHCVLLTINSFVQMYKYVECMDGWCKLREENRKIAFTNNFSWISLWVKTTAADWLEWVQFSQDAFFKTLMTI